MKRNGFIIIVIFMLVALTGCVHKNPDNQNIANKILKERENTGENSQPEEQNTEDNRSQQEEVAVKALSPGTYRYQTIQDRYPDKIVLVYAVEQREAPDDRVVDGINDYLTKQGTDYVVWFKEVKVDKGSNYTDQIRKEIDSDNPIDIIYCALPTINDAISPYDALIQDGVLQCFDDFLETDKGKSLLQALPNGNWEALKRSGRIYGVNGYSFSISTPMSYYVNKELMDKYHLTKEDLKKPLAELSDVLSEVANGEKNRENFSVITAALSYRYPEFHSVTNAVVLNENNDEGASLLLDSDGYLGFLKALHYYQSLDMVGVQTKYVKDFFLQANLSSGVPFEKPDYGAFVNKKDVSAGQDDVVQIIFDEYSSYVNQFKFATGINSNSEHMDMAFDFLTRVFSDASISNMLLYGIEGVNYITKDGKLPPNTDYGFFSIIFGNSYISVPLDFEYKNKKEIYFTVQNKAKVSKYANFLFDKSNVIKQISDTNSVMGQVSKIFEGGVSDFDEFIDDMKQQLYDKGVQDVIDEVNRQLAASK